MSPVFLAGVSAILFGYAFLRYGALNVVRDTLATASQAILRAATPALASVVD